MTSRLSKARRPFRIELGKRRVPVGWGQEGVGWWSGKTSCVSCGAWRRCQLIGSRCANTPHHPASAIKVLKCDMGGGVVFLMLASATKHLLL